MGESSSRDGTTSFWRKRGCTCLSTETGQPRSVASTLARGMAAADRPPMYAAMDSKPLEIKGVLKDTWLLYRTLFVRSFLTGFVVFAALGVFERSPYLAALVGFIGTTLVQGELVEGAGDGPRGKSRRRRAAPHPGPGP